MKRFVAALLFAVPSALFAQDATTVPAVSLEDAIRIAEESAPSMRTSRQNVRSAKLGVTRSYLAFAPTISTGASYRPAQNGARQNFTSQISVGLNNFFNWNTYFAVSTSKRSLATAEATAVQSRYQLRTTVKNQYFAVLQAQEALANSERQLVVAEENMKLVRTRLNTGMVVASDTLSNLIAVLNAQSALIAGQATLQNNIRTFSRTLGIENLVRPDPRDTANFKIIQIDSVALLGMIQDAPAAVTSRAQIENAKSNLRSAKLAFVPTPSSSLSWNRSAQGSSVFGFTDGLYRYSTSQPSFQLSLSLPIFNAFNREATLISARETLENAQYNYRDQQLNVESQLLNQISTIRNLERQLTVQELSLLAAEEQFRVQTLRNNIGLLTEIEVTTARNALFTAQNNIVNTRYAYRNAIAALEQLVGRDLR
jgi:outer membrane protein TolC